ncbi:hypothetical protein [Pseudomonas synxantha]|nr:hypothetical protein [Pseudomonas synxantha]
MSEAARSDASPSRVLSPAEGPTVLSAHTQSQWGRRTLRQVAEFTVETFMTRDLHHRLEQQVDEDHTTVRELVECTLQAQLNLMKARIAPLPNKRVQQPAPPGALLTIEKQGALFCARHRVTNAVEPADGPYLFIVPTDEPGILLAARNEPHNSVFPTETVEGHTSLSNGLPVYFAGTARFEQGRLRYWSNDSGHYLPPGHSRHALLPYLGKLLSDELFYEVSRR